jgi:hypothetical protein
MKKLVILILFLASGICFNTARSQNLGTVEVGEYFNNLSLEFSGSRKYFKTNKIYFKFTMFDGINGKIGTDFCKIEVDTVDDNNSEKAIFTDKYEVDREWYTTWTTIELPNGRYLLRLYDERNRLMGKSIVFTVNK